MSTTLQENQVFWVSETQPLLSFIHVTCGFLYQPCSASQPLHVVYTMNIMCKYFIHILLYLLCSRHHWLLSFYTTFSGLCLSRVSNGQQKKPKQTNKKKHVGFIFSHSFQVNWIKWSVVMKQFKLNILILLLSDSYWFKGNNCWFADCQKTHSSFRFWAFTKCFWFFYTGMVLNSYAKICIFSVLKLCFA